MTVPLLGYCTLGGTLCAWQPRIRCPMRRTCYVAMARERDAWCAPAPMLPDPWDEASVDAHLLEALRTVRVPRDPETTGDLVACARFAATSNALAGLAGWQRPQAGGVRPSPESWSAWEQGLTAVKHALRRLVASGQIRLTARPGHASVIETAPAAQEVRR